MNWNSFVVYRISRILAGLPCHNTGHRVSSTLCQALLILTWIYSITCYNQRDDVNMMLLWCDYAVIFYNIMYLSWCYFMYYIMQSFSGYKYYIHHMYCVNILCVHKYYIYNLRIIFITYLRRERVTEGERGNAVQYSTVHFSIV